MSNEIKNTSGMGKDAKVPQTVLGYFNWGAFFLNWIWGLGNKTYVTLLIFVSIIAAIIPIIGAFVPLGMCIWFGIKGNEWAWQNKRFESVKSFHEIQKKWAIAGLIAMAIGILFSIISMGAMIAAISGAGAK